MCSVLRPDSSCLVTLHRSSRQFLLSGCEFPKSAWARATMPGFFVPPVLFSVVMTNSFSSTHVLFWTSPEMIWFHFHPLPNSSLTHPPPCRSRGCFLLNKGWFIPAATSEHTGCEARYHTGSTGPHFSVHESSSKVKKGWGYITSHYQLLHSSPALTTQSLKRQEHWINGDRRKNKL